MYAIREKTKAAVQVCAACGGTYEKAIQEPIPASSCKEPEQTAGVQPYPDHLRQFCDRDRTGVLCKTGTQSRWIFKGGKVG